MNGWLIDVSIHDDGAHLLFKSNGKKNLVKDPYAPSFFLVCDEPELSADIMSKHPLVKEATVEQKFASLHDKSKKTVVRVFVAAPSDMAQVIKDAKKLPGLKEIAETTIPDYYKYMLERGLRFFHYYDVERTKFAEKETPAMPELKIGAVVKKGFKLYSGFEFSPQYLDQWIAENNIDVLVTWKGDSFLPQMIRNRRLEEKGFPLENCLHLDVTADMSCDIYAEGEAKPSHIIALEDLGRKRLARSIELSYMTGAKPFLVSRITPGRLNTYLHIRSAKEMGYIIPDLKREIERPKSLQTLLTLDRGGTIFYPTPGIYENVAKCDFSSMYPNIIVRNNISPETMQCKDCSKPIPVPWTEWMICGERQGIIPAGIKSVLLRRLELKHAMRKETDPALRETLDTRQRALKNILVTCFGYLGFNNFVFSNVECKECVMLYGRHVLLQAKVIADDFNFRVVYGIVDSLFLDGGNSDSYSKFAKEVSSQSGIELEFQDVFTRIIFPASRDSSGAANKYYGVTEKGALEARGIAIRHSDACKLVTEFQRKAALEILTANRVWDGYAKASEILKDYKQRLSRGEFEMKDFVITIPLSKPIEQYSSNAPHVVAFRQSQRGGNVSDFVYSVTGPKPFELAKINEIDARRYSELLEASLSELVRGITINKPAS